MYISIMAQLCYRHISQNIYHIVFELSSQPTISGESNIQSLLCIFDGIVVVCIEMINPRLLDLTKESAMAL